MSNIIRWVLLLILTGSSLVGYGQKPAPTDSLPAKKQNTRKIIVGTGVGLSYGLGMWGLGSLWYKDLPKTSFHFFNDIRGWKGMDKAGHGFSAYHAARFYNASFTWAGYSQKKSLLLSSIMGWTAVSSIEYFDGRSEGWGASPTDLLANTTGIALFTGQQLLWQEQRITMKESFYLSPYAKYSPELLGEDWYGQIFKDYNGQTYWLSTNIASFAKEGNKIPKWLNIAVGYGADGMISAVKNPRKDENGEPLPYFERHKQWYLSLDMDLTKIKTKSKFVRTVLFALNLVKVPMPTLEYNRQDNFQFHWLF